MPKITISLGDDEIKILEKRAKKNLLALNEQVEDIIRRSCVGYKQIPNLSKLKPDDRLIQIFSREKRGGISSPKHGQTREKRTREIRGSKRK